MTMINWLKQMDRRLNSLNVMIGHAVSWLSLCMVLIIFAVVVLRYGFNYGSIAFQESATYLHALAFMLAMGYTLSEEGHVRVDIFYRTMSIQKRAWVNLLGTIGLLIPFCIFVVVSSWNYTGQSIALLEGSREAGGLPFVYVLKSAIPAMAILLFLQGVCVVCNSLITILERR